MGTSAIGCHRLQRVAVLSALWCGFTAVVLFGFICGARAQIVPAHVTLAYSGSHPEPLAINVRRPNGNAAYQLSLQPEKAGSDVLFLSIVLRKAGTDRNLLEPPGNWHGYQEFMVAAWDLANGPEKSIYPIRKFELAKDNLKITCTVSKARVRPSTIPSPQGQFAFDELVLEVDVENAK